MPSIASWRQMALVATAPGDPNQYIPYGPFIALGAIISLFWGHAKARMPQVEEYARWRYAPLLTPAP
jgi:hypothetical protein